MLLRNGQTIEVLDRGSTHKWLGCMLCTANTGSHTLDLAHHLHAASKAFYANRPYLVNRNVAMRDRYRYCNAMVTPVACFGAAHRKIYKQDLCKMDIVFRRLLRSIVGPPGDVDWTLPWHEILHHWNERVVLAQGFGSRFWLKVSAQFSRLGFVTLFVMPLSQQQVFALKNADTKIMVQMENPKKVGSKAWDRFEKYKHAKSIGEATQAGANWQDVSVDFEKGFLKVMESIDEDMPPSTKLGTSKSRRGQS